MRPDGAARRSFSYSLYRLYRLQVLVMMAIFVVAAAGLIVASIRGGRDLPPIWFRVGWIGIVFWVGYWFLLRVIYRLEVRDRELRWEAPLRRGSVPVSEIVRLRPFRLGSNMEVIETEGRGRLLTFAMKGLDQFAQALEGLNPDISHRFGVFARIAFRMPWARSRFSNE